MDSGLIKLISITVSGGVIGSVMGAVVSFFSRTSKIRLDYALAIGFLVGAAFGAFFGTFESMIGRI